MASAFSTGSLPRNWKHVGAQPGLDIQPGTPCNQSTGCYALLFLAPYPEHAVGEPHVCCPCAILLPAAPCPPACHRESELSPLPGALWRGEKMHFS